jgi:hypothetical protein
MGERVEPRTWHQGILLRFISLLTRLVPRTPVAYGAPGQNYL